MERVRMPVTAQVVSSKESRTELLAWLNDLLQNKNFSGYAVRQVGKVEQCGNGVPYVLLLPSMLPVEYPPLVTKAKVPAKHDFESVANLKLVTEALQKNGIPRPDVLTFEMDKLIKGAFQANLQFLQWFRGLYDVLPSRLTDQMCGNSVSSGFTLRICRPNSVKKDMSPHRGSTEMYAAPEMPQAKGIHASQKANVSSGGSASTAPPLLQKNGSPMTALSPLNIPLTNTELVLSKTVSQLCPTRSSSTRKIHNDSFGEGKCNSLHSSSVKQGPNPMRTHPPMRKEVMSEPLRSSESDSRNTCSTPARKKQTHSPLLRGSRNSASSHQAAPRMIKVDMLHGSGSVARLPTDCSISKEAAGFTDSVTMGNGGEEKSCVDGVPCNIQQKETSGVVSDFMSALKAVDSKSRPQPAGIGEDETSSCDSKRLLMVENERQFYYDKLRCIEELALPIVERKGVQQDVVELARSVLKILHSTQ